MAVETDNTTTSREAEVSTRSGHRRRKRKINWHKIVTVEPIAFIYAMCLLLIQPASQRTLFTMICLRGFVNGAINLNDFVVNGTMSNVTVNSSAVYVVRVNHSSTTVTNTTTDGSSADYVPSYDYYYYGDDPGLDSDSFSGSNGSRTVASTTVSSYQQLVYIDAFKFCTRTIYEKTAASRAANNIVSGSTSEWNTLIGLSTSVPGMFTSVILGAYTDLHNRRRLLFLLSFSATFCNSLIYALVSYSPIGLFSLHPNGSASTVSYTRSVAVTVFEKVVVPIVPGVRTTSQTTSTTAPPGDPDYYYDNPSDGNDIVVSTTQSTTTTALITTTSLSTASTTANYSTVSASSINWVPYEVVLVGEFLEGFFGGQAIVSASSFAYISVLCSSAKSRSWRITVMQATLYVGAGVGTLVSGFVMQAWNAFYVFLLVAFLMVVNALYTLLWLRELPPNTIAGQTNQPKTEGEVSSASAAENDFTDVAAQDQDIMNDIIVPDGVITLEQPPERQARESDAQEEEEGPCSCFRSCCATWRSSGLLVCAAVRAVFRKRETPLRTALFGILLASMMSFMLVLSADKSLSFLYLTGSVYALSTSIYGMFNAGVYFASCFALLVGLRLLQRALPRVEPHWFALPGVIGKIAYLALLGAAFTTDVYYLVIMVVVTSLQGWTLASLRLCISQQVDRNELTRVFSFMNSSEVLLLSLGSLLFNYAIYPRTVSTFPAASFYVASVIGAIDLVLLILFALLKRRISRRKDDTCASAEGGTVNPAIEQAAEEPQEEQVDRTQQEQEVQEAQEQTESQESEEEQQRPEEEEQDSEEEQASEEEAERGCAELEIPADTPSDV